MSFNALPHRPMTGEGSLGQGIIFVSLGYGGILSFREKVVKNPPVKKYDGNDLNHLRYHVVWTGNDDVKSKLFQDYKIELFQAKTGHAFRFENLEKDQTIFHSSRAWSSFGQAEHELFDSLREFFRDK